MSAEGYDPEADDDNSEEKVRFDENLIEFTDSAENKSASTRLPLATTLKIDLSNTKSDSILVIMILAPILSPRLL